MANPSLAVIDTKNHMHSDYGEISLIPRSSLIDSKTGRNAGTFAGDAWTSTYPQVEKRMSDKGRDAYYKDVNGVSEDRSLTGELKMVWDNYMEGRNPDNLAYWFLKEQGIEPEKIFFDSGYTEEQRKRYAELTDNGRKGFEDMSDEERSGIIAMMAEQDGISAEEKLAKYQMLRERNQEILAKEDTKPYRKVQLQRIIDEIDKYGITLSPVSDFLYGMKRALENDGKLNVGGTLSRARDKMQADGLDADFKRWLEEKEQKYGVKEMLFDGYTRDGDRKYVPNTVENASKMMNHEAEANARGQAGFGATRAVLLGKMQSLADIRKQKGKLKGIDEDTEQRYQAASDEMFQVVNALADMQKISDNPLSNVEYANYRLQEALGKKDPIGWLNKEYGYDISKDGEFAKGLSAMLQTLENLPVKYFETKFRRPVGLDEFAVAVVPENTSEEVVDALRNAGLDVRTYDNTGSLEQQAENRRLATMEAVQSRNDIMFQKAGEPGEGYGSEGRAAGNAHLSVDEDLSTFDPLAFARSVTENAKRTMEMAKQAVRDKRTQRDQALVESGLVSGDNNLTDLEKTRRQKDLIRSVGNVQSLLSETRKGALANPTAVVEAAREMLNYLPDGVTKNELDRILGGISRSMSKSNVRSEVNKACNVVLNAIRRQYKNTVNRLIYAQNVKVNAQSVKQTGVRGIDARGERSMKSLREGIKLTYEQLDEKISDAEDRVNNATNNISKRNAEDELNGLYLAKTYQQTIGEVEADLNSIIYEKRKAEEELKALQGRNKGPAEKARYDVLRETIESCNEAMIDNHARAVKVYEQYGKMLAGFQSEAKGRQKSWIEERKKRKNDIIHDANGDFLGQYAGLYEGEQRKSGWDWISNAFASSFGAPLQTFDTYMRHFGRQVPRGEGRLWNRFMSQWHESANREWEMSKRDNENLDNKANELFGVACFTDMVEQAKKADQKRSAVKDPQIGRASCRERV